MSDILIALSTWLHAIATIVMVGYFVFMSLIFLPVFERRMPSGDLRDLLQHVSARLRPFFGGSLLIFLVTGTYLMLSNKNYLGLGNFFANPWSVLIVVKHVIVVAFLALAVIPERIYLEKISDDKPEILLRYRLSLNANLIIGMLILLLTAIAQVV
jgi:uncharacterized membrane protein